MRAELVERPGAQVGHLFGLRFRGDGHRRAVERGLQELVLLLDGFHLGFQFLALGFFGLHVLGELHGVADGRLDVVELLGVEGVELAHLGDEVGLEGLEAVERLLHLLVDVGHGVSLQFELVEQVDERVLRPTVPVAE